MANLPDGIITWMHGHYTRARDYQTSRGIEFKLTFLEYQSLWSPKKLEKLVYWHQSGRIAKAMKHPRHGYVLSWRAKADRASGILDITTARIITRAASEKRFFLQAGETHSEAAKIKIGDAQRGRIRSAAHKAAISKARAGTKQTPEQIAKRVAATKATKLLKLQTAQQP
jgi:hypothetical protein